MLSTIFLFTLLSTFMSLPTQAAPTRTRALEARAKCGDGGESPCICGGTLGIRNKSLQCPSESFKFQNPTSTTGKVALVPGNLGSVQCDHIVELQFIANEINKVPAICTKFQASNTDFQAFFNKINASPNLVFVEGTVNNAKGQIFGGNNLKETSRQAGDGLISYLEQLKSGGKAAAAAKAVDTAMTTAMGTGNGFPTGFATRFNTAITNAVTKVKGQLATLPPAPTPGDPFIDCTDSTIAKAQKAKRSIWDNISDLIARAVTGKKTAPVKACPRPAKPVPPTKPVTPTKPGTLAKPATVAKPAPPAKPIVKPIAKPIAKPITQPVIKPIAKPILKSTKKPRMVRSALQRE